MKNVYLYPNSARTENAVENPYMGNLKAALRNHFEVVNANKPSAIGIFDILKYLRNLDVVYFNWAEELPSLHRGRLQGYFLMILLPILRLSGTKIVWTLHNKESHFDQHRKLKKRLYSLMLKKSDLIITHAKEGLDLIPKGKKAAFLHHPVNSPVAHANPDGDRQFDIIIWGTIAPYKGILSFLEFMEQSGIIENYRILLAGKVTTPSLALQLKKYSDKYKKIVLMDGYVEKDQLIKLIQDSGITLFTYHSDSILSSGALMDSLSYGAYIIGPAVGAFNDLQELGLIDTYTDFSSLTKLLDKKHLSSDVHSSRIDNIGKFIESNSWEAFSNSIKNLINNN